MLQRLGLVFFATVLVSAEATACSCVRPTPAVLIARSETVFSGSVRALGTAPDGRQAATIRVTRRIKGRVPDRVVVLTRRMAVSCGYPMEAGKRYTFAGSVDRRGEMSVTLCTMMPLNTRT
jgi:hypothetical protein